MKAIYDVISECYYANSNNKDGNRHDYYTEDKLNEYKHAKYFHYHEEYEDRGVINIRKIELEDAVYEKVLDAYKKYAFDKITYAELQQVAQNAGLESNVCLFL